MNTLINDIKYAVRQLIKSPGFTAIAIISLALSIGAVTSVFSLYNALMLKKLPVRDAEQLRVLTWKGDINANFTHCRVFSYPDREGTGNVVSYPLYSELRDQVTDLAEVFAFSKFGQFDPFTVVTGKEAFTAHGLIVSGNFFEGLGITTQIGQPITPANDTLSAEPVAVISQSIWQRHFNGNPDVIGQTVLLNRHNFTIIGVLPEGFLGPVGGIRCDFYVPMSVQVLVRPNCSLTDSRLWWVQVMARMLPGVSDKQFGDSLNTLFGQIVATEGMCNSDVPARIIIENGSKGPLGPRSDFRDQSLLVVMGIAGTVLLAACANIASLLLARGAARQHESAVRAALGAGAWRLVRQGLTESMLIALAGAAGGLMLSVWGQQVLFNMFWSSHAVFDLSLDVTVLGFTILICVGSAFLFGLLPAWRYSRVNPIVSLRERSSSALSRMRLGKWMVSIQTALALLLLAGAGLFMRTLINLYQVDTGFKTENLLVFSLDGCKADLKDQQLTDFYEQVRSTVAALPGVQNAAHSNILMLSGWMNNSMAEVPGRSTDDRIPILGLSVSDSYLSTMDISLLLGRDFSVMDNEAGQPVILVNETLARTAFPVQNPIGQTLTIGREYNIVGVFEDIKYVSLQKAAEPTVFYSCRQRQGYLGKVFYQVRIRSNPMATIPAIRQIIADINPNVPMTDIKTQAIQLNESIASERSFAVLAMSLAVLAVLLSCIGLFGLMSYYTTQRTGEIGIRKALGAQPWDVGFSVLRSAILLVLIGVVIGIPMILVTSRLIRSYLFGIRPYDPVTVIGAAFLLILVSIAAVWLPARRAAKIDPMEALRYE
jgi:predicted permease